ncbi:hypothetical protein Salat_0852000 [Sesamum alatum]|uniref:Uncharacterized protein n=1 Tax=Sesamum alatum TaxID=300844 RepID=A0AAE1YIL0_9LAMI|nr:hypothetical protein Salat_0852000 [Sesamum alatum]
MTVENYALDSFPETEEEEEEADRLSFCNLPIGENYSGSTVQSPRASSAQTDHFFEFFTTHPGPAASHSFHNDIIFCGKIFHEDQLNEYQKRDYFATIRSQSLRKPSFSDSDNRRFSGDLIRPKCAAGDLDYHVQRVNITSLTSMSAKSRRRMFMFGPVKFKPKMELSAIKQRQARRASGAEKAAGGASRWGVVRSSLRGRSHLTSVLARSFGCIPVAGGGGGVERWVGVAN